MLPRSNLVDIQRDVPKCVPLESLRPWRGTGRRGQARFGVPPVVALVAPVLDLQPSGFMVRVCSNPQVQSLTRGDHLSSHQLIRAGVKEEQTAGLSCLRSPVLLGCADGCRPTPGECNEAPSFRPG